MNRLVGTNSFRRLTRASGVQVRIMEALGIVRPYVSDKGWRMFREADIASAKKWVEARRAERKAGRRGRRRRSMLTELVEKTRNTEPTA